MTPAGQKRGSELLTLYIYFAVQVLEVSGSIIFRRNMKAVSFLPLLARLAIESGVLFDGEEEHGGLLWKYQNCYHVLHKVLFIATQSGIIFRNIMRLSMLQ